MKRKHINTKYIILIIAIIIMVILAIFSYTLKEDRKLNKFESFMKDTIIMSGRIITYPIRIVLNKIDEYNDLKDIRKKYNTILNNVDRIDSLNAENIELRNQIDALKKELDIDYTINGYSYLNATVTLRNISSWYNTITIDKGSYNGIEEGMAVVNSRGLIGKVSKVSTFNSEVKLLSTNTTNNKISVSIIHNNEKLFGLINNYNYKDNYLEVEGISNTLKVSIGDLVYTSGLGGVFPSGILIGKVKEITTDEYDLSKELKVEPIVDFNNINFVAVLKRKDDKK